MKPKADMQRCVEAVLSAKMWVFAEIMNVGLPLERLDAAILRAESMDACFAAYRDWLSAEQQVRLRVDKLASSRMASGRPHEIPPALHYWYWIRLRSAQQLTRMIVPYDHSRTIFCVPPTMTKQKMLRWLLTSWWSDGGVTEWTFTWLDLADELQKRKN